MSMVIREPTRECCHFEEREILDVQLGLCLRFPRRTWPLVGFIGVDMLRVLNVRS